LGSGLTGFSVTVVRVEISSHSEQNFVCPLSHSWLADEWPVAKAASEFDRLAFSHIIEL
jgi:hypothetical protein